jgi:hypothetical protein
MEGKVSIPWLGCARRNSRPQKRLSQRRLVWGPSGKEPVRRLEAHQAQLLVAAGNPETAAAPVWRKVS